ncbi:MAG TPA: ABC transporter permease subunit [Polyangia bacterium]|nr:ABC transporter permease subunit [Polyangia bacterium]
MLARELAIALRSRLAWLQAALSALLIGHGFVLAVDLYSAGARSAQAGTLMAREFDPLLGIVRPTLGGLYLAVSLLGPLVAARPLAIEKERRTFHALLLQTASPARLTGAKLLGALLSAGLQLVAPVLLLLLWLALGGHLALGETLVPLAGHAFYILLIAALGTACAAWTRSLAQAATTALVLVAASWAIDAAEGFAALAWLGRAFDWSVTTHLGPLEHGVAALDAGLWMLCAAGGLFAAAWIGVRSEGAPVRRGLALAAVLAGTAGACALAHRLPWRFDLTEAHRQSLPPAAVAGLRALGGPLRIEVYLDSDDARRRQLEADVLAKLRLARPDLRVEDPLDGREAPAEGERDEGYGRLVLHVGAKHVETYSTSRRELVTLLFEAAGRPPPDWQQPEYPGYPLVIAGRARTALLLLAYAGLPGTLLLLGWLVTRSKRRS